MKILIVTFLITCSVCGQITKMYWYDSHPRDTAIYAKVKSDSSVTRISRARCGYFDSIYIAIKMYADSISARKIDASSIALNSGDLLSVYDTSSFACSLKTSDVTVQQIGTAYYTKIGNNLTISFPYLSGTSNSTSFRLYCTIPYWPKQTYAGYNSEVKVVRIADNGVAENGIIAISNAFSGYFYISRNTGTFTSSGTKTIYPFSVSFITEN